MDGYVRFNTDEEGKIVHVWDTWFKDGELEECIGGCGFEHYFGDYTFKENSLILVTFNHKSEIVYSYMDGEEYNDWIEIEDEIVLIENYDWEDIGDIEEGWVPNEDKYSRMS